MVYQTCCEYLKHEPECMREDHTQTVIMRRNVRKAAMGIFATQEIWLFFSDTFSALQRTESQNYSMIKS